MEDNEWFGGVHREIMQKFWTDSSLSLFRHLPSSLTWNQLPWLILYHQREPLIDQSYSLWWANSSRTFATTPQSRNLGLIWKVSLIRDKRRTVDSTRSLYFFYLPRNNTLQWRSTALWNGLRQTIGARPGSTSSIERLHLFRCFQMRHPERDARERGKGLANGLAHSGHVTIFLSIHLRTA